ncbi:hypothetical protein F2Q68_00039477 [Brassica cretica]|uniref:Uncharacterized protein n=1 Tax=Brassica cretica TaxID=69181 RepID=A0A8S9MIW6_BRACR|nr:hypothetical protein F2Q68_00039477 [Brassica cretica]
MSKVVLDFLDVALVEAINRPSKRRWWKNKTLRHLLSQKQEMKFVVERPLANIGVFRIAQSVRRSPYRKLSSSRRKGVVPGTGPGILSSGDPGRLLARTQSFPLIARFRHRTRGITCALKSTGVAHSQQASLRQDIVPVILLSRVPLRPEPHSEPGGGPVPL